MKMKKMTLFIIIAILIITITAFSAYAAEQKHKDIKNIDITMVEGADNIPVELISQTEDITLFNIKIEYKDGTETEMTSLDKADGDSVWMDSHYEDKENEDGSVIRTYYFEFYFDDLVTGRKTISNRQDNITFKPLANQEFKADFGSKFKVTRKKNWQLVNIIPSETGMYRLSKYDNENAKIYVLDGSKITQCRLSEQFEMTQGEKYSILVKYDVSDVSNAETVDNSGEDE